MPMVIGQQVPDFRLLDDQGLERTLADFAGRTLVLYFYPANFTPGCTREAEDFRDLAAEFSTAGAQVVGVSPDSVASHQKFRAKYTLPFTLLSDPEHQLASAYGVWALKTNFGKTKEGIVRTTMVIDGEGRLVKQFSKVKVNGHASAVLSCLT